MKKEVKKLKKKLRKKTKKQRYHNFHSRRNRGTIDFLILDGNFKINVLIPQKPIIKADEKVFSCSAASILAKVYRDRIMERYHREYPEYGFERHKGYPTKYHVRMLRKYGACKIHRESFGPVKNLLN